MKKLLMFVVALALFATTPVLHESTIWTITSGSSTATIQSTINGASAGDVVQFNAATYNISSGITLKCGITYTATAPATPSNVILNGTFTRLSGNIFNLFQSSCTQTTTIQYLQFMHEGGIYVQTSFSNLVITHNQFGDIPCCNSFADAPSAGIFFDGGSSNARSANNVTISWNQIGDSTSCTGPTFDDMTDYTSPEQKNGNCEGIGAPSSINGMNILNNVIGPVSEGVHILCYGNNCQPTQTPPGPIIRNLIARGNDFVGIHRIAWEEQPQVTSGSFFQYNSLHDSTNPYFGNFAVSMACCDSGATAPGITVSDNTLIQNVSPHVRYGYGIEAWGLGANYSNNLIQGLGSPQGIAWCYGMGSGTVSNNTVQGPNYSAGGVPFGGNGYIGNEGTNGGCSMGSPATVTGNVTGSTASAVTSVAPTLPASGFLLGPITVTDPGFTSGPQPRGNTSIYCTTDGSTPTVSSPLYTGPLAVSYPVTVKCIGMWGTGANTKTYPSGYGFVPSAVVTGTYTSAAAAATPVLTPGSTSFATSLSVSMSDATIGATIYYTTDGTTPTTSSTVYTGPITVTGASTVVKAIATHAGNSQSAVATGTYISTTVVSTPTFSPPSESFTGSVSVSISDLTPSSTIYYTTDGSTPGTTGGGGGGATYYLSPSGSDSNAGTSSGSPWLSPNHAVNCGDTIIAAAGTYSAANFQNGKWGAVTCASGKNVAWLKCATFDACKITATGSDAIWVDASYWGVQGWETSTNTTPSGACFHAGPSGSTSIHHVIFANDVANGCMGGGFTAYNKPTSTTASVDYIAYVGNVAYNAAQGNGACYSGLNIYQPIASDTNSGTHMFIAGNFSYNNVDASPCSGGFTTDGEGINLDTFDYSQLSGTAYTQQAAVENNISVSNGSSAILVENNKTGTSQAPVFIKQNTTYGNLKATNLSFCLGHGEITAQAALHVTATGNLASTNSATGCSSDAIYAAAVADSDNTVSVAGNWLQGTSGNNTFISSSGSFAYGSNVLGTSPAFVSTTIPGAPSCGSSANVPACMAGLISNFTPTAPTATAYGYHVPSSTPITDPYFPTWLCNTGLPSGLVSMPCGQVYTGPITVSTTTTVKAIATASGLTTSAIGSATYTLTGGGGGPTTTATPTAAPAAGTYFATQSVTLSDSTSGASICYTTDGSTPAAISGACTAGTTYSGAISVSSSETVNAIGTKSGLTNSPVAAFSYTISIPTPAGGGNIDYNQIKAAERLGTTGTFFQMVNVGSYSAVNTATPCNSTNQGATAFVLDSSTSTYGAAVSGGGSNKIHALCNGTAWVVD